MSALHDRPATAITYTDTDTDSDSNGDSARDSDRDSALNHHSAHAAANFGPNPGSASDSKHRPDLSAALLRGGEEHHLPVAKHADLHPSRNRVAT